MNIKKVVLASALGVAALAGTNLPGLEATKASAASVETDLVTIEGSVVEVGENYFVMKSDKYNEDFDNLLTVNVKEGFKLNVKVGDRVNATGSLWRGFGTSMTATSVEKVDVVNMAESQETLHEGKYNPGVNAYEYEIGYVTVVKKDSVLFEYTGKNGEKLEMAVDLRKGQVFNVNDKVKVHTSNAAWGFSSGVFTVFGEIEKVNN